MIQINFNSYNSNSQIIFYQEILNGEVSFIGTSSGDGNATITFPTNLADGTTPKKVFLICHGQKGNNYIPTFKKFKIDGNPFLLDTLNPSILLVGNNTIPSGDYNGHVTYVVDLTDYINIVNSSIEIEWIYDGFFPPSDCPGCHIAAPTLLIINEDISFPKISISLILNNKNNDDIINLNIENLNQANFNFPIGAGIQTDRLGASTVDGYNFEINNQNAGSISTTDPDLYCIYSGAIGCFHYGNNVLTGLTGDTPDSLFSGTDPLIHNADGLIDMNSYLNNVISPIDFEFSYNGSSFSQHNFFVSTAISYSTDCNSINGLAIKDTIICKGETIQLSASGGVNYEWLPQTDLSCINCPNPIFSGDSSQLYTVRIWANDTCSVVRPIMVKVRQQPQTTSYFQSYSLCGDSTATINWQNIGTNEYSIDNSIFQNSGIFNLVGSGNHTLTIKDTFGCVYDTLISIASYTTVNSNFTATPTTGEEPLLVQLSESNSNDDGYWWNINGILYPSSQTEFNFINSGSYQISLIAFQNDSACTDTSSITIVVYNDLTLTIPNVITANNDGVNDSFEIIGLDNFPNNELYIFNRWGNEVFHMVNYDNSWKGECKNGFGKKDELPTGTYYYIFNAEGIESVHGFIWLQR